MFTILADYGSLLASEGVVGIGDLRPYVNESLATSTMDHRIRQVWQTRVGYVCNTGVGPSGGGIPVPVVEKCGCRSANAGQIW